MRVVNLAKGGSGLNDSLAHITVGGESVSKLWMVMCNQWYIYVLYSKTLNKSYIGFTEDVNKRLHRHNTGQVSATKSGCPWVVIYTEEFKNNKDAIKREKYFKSGAGRRKLKLIFEDYWRGA